MQISPNRENCANGSITVIPKHISSSNCATRVEILTAKTATEYTLHVANLIPNGHVKKSELPYGTVNTMEVWSNHLLCSVKAIIISYRKLGVGQKPVDSRVDSCKGFALISALQKCDNKHYELKVDKYRTQRVATFDQDPKAGKLNKWEAFCKNEEGYPKKTLDGTLADGFVECIGRQSGDKGLLYNWRFCVDQANEKEKRCRKK